ncbi:hypothetical protein [Brachybacterium sp. NPDC056505]|uniref:hypothetical protein n=1 Tax=Brachybacterium sp. NPDC056505 TaxID=3345843 RepID=UPI00366CE585
MSDQPIATADQPIVIEYRVRLANVRPGFTGRRNILAEGRIHADLPIPVEADGITTAADGSTYVTITPNTAAAVDEFQARITAMADGFTAPLTSREEAAGARPHHPPHTSR